MDRALVQHVLHEELDGPPTDPVIGLKFTDEAEVIAAFDAREHAGRERANGILAHAQLELSVRAPFPDPRCFDDVGIDQERRHGVTLSEGAEALEVLDRWNAKRPAERNVDLLRWPFAKARALGGL